MSPAPFLIPAKMSYFVDTPLSSDRLRKSVIQDIIPLLPNRINTAWDIFSGDALAGINLIPFSDRVMCNVMDIDTERSMLLIRDGKSDISCPKRTLDAYRSALGKVELVHIPWEHIVRVGFGGRELPLSAGDFVFCYAPLIGEYVPDRSDNGKARHPFRWAQGNMSELLGLLSSVQSAGAGFGAVLSLGRGISPNSDVVGFCEKNGYEYRRVGSINGFSRGTTTDDIVYVTNRKP